MRKSLSGPHLPCVLLLFWRQLIYLYICISCNSILLHGHFTVATVWCGMLTLLSCVIRKLTFQITPTAAETRQLSATLSVMRKSQNSCHGKRLLHVFVCWIKLHVPEIVRKCLGFHTKLFRYLFIYFWLNFSCKFVNLSAFYRINKCPFTELPSLSANNVVSSEMVTGTLRQRDANFCYITFYSSRISVSEVSLNWMVISTNCKLHACNPYVCERQLMTFCCKTNRVVAKLPVSWLLACAFLSEILGYLPFCFLWSHIEDTQKLNK